MTSNVNNISESGVIHTGTSDHSLIYAIRKGRKIRTQPKVIQNRSNKHFKPENFNEDLHTADWSNMYAASTIHETAKAFNDIVNDIANKHAPKVTVRIKGSIPTIFSNELLLLMKERDAMKRKAARSKSADDWAQYKRMRNQINRQNIIERREHFRGSLTQESRNLKKLWKKLKELVPGKNDRSSRVQRLQVSGKDETNARNIADHINEFFVNVGANLAAKISGGKNPLAFVTKSSQNTFRAHTIDGNKVVNLIKSLKEGKATGLDGISVKMLKAGK